MPLSPSETRDLLARLGHTPKRFLGQNFLVDGNIVRKSLELAQVGPGDHVVEVGPGLGTLTEALAEAGALIHAVEKDSDLYHYLSESLLPRYPQRINLIEADAMDYPLAALSQTGVSSDFKIVANLPYAISTPWMDAVLEGPLPSRMVLMLQKEAADRYAAPHGSKTFGAISVFLQAAYCVEPGHKVSGACFYPRPDIDSFLLNLKRREVPFVFPKRIKTIIRACFQQRRKQLGTLLKGLLPDGGQAWFSLLEIKGLDARTRPEQVPCSLWMELCKAYDIK